MSENLSVLRLQDGELCWVHPGRGAVALSEGSGDLERLLAQLEQGNAPVVFAAPGADLRLTEIEVSREERRHLDTYLPFALEETLSEDIEAVHFARQELDKERFAVALVGHGHMQSWQAQLEHLPGLKSWIPEPLLLPWEPGHWTLLVEDGQLLLRYGRCLGACVEPLLAGPLLEALLAEQAPGHVVIYGESESADRALIPAGCEANVEWRRGGLDSALMLTPPELSGPELLQGEYAPRLPYERWWSQWRAVAAALLAALGLHVAAGWLDYRTLEKDNLALRGEIEAVYREVNPRGAVVDAETQLRRQLTTLRGGEGGAGFSALLAPLGKIVARQDGAVLASLNYSQRGGELRVNLLLPSFASVEQLRQGLVAEGLSATLENSARSGDGVRARLRIEAGS